MDLCVATAEHEAVDNLIVVIKKQYPQNSGRQAKIYACASSEVASEIETVF
jgi:hypothetical protein